MVRRSRLGLAALGFAACASPSSSGDATSSGGSTSGSTTADTTGPTTTGASASSSSVGSTAGSTSNGSGSSTGGPVACPSFDDGVEAGALGSAEIGEASGLGVSRTQDDVLWVHNDSGDTARVFAISTAGALRAEFTLTGVTAIDWEDLALVGGAGAEPDELIVADIGDNDRIRASITLWRFPEPDVASAGPGPTAVDNAVGYELAYPGKAHDAETLLADPATGDLFVVTKEFTGPSFVFRIPATADPTSITTLEEVATLPFGAAPLVGGTLTTAGDISSDGGLIIIRTYTNAFAWRRAADTSVAEALQSEPCPLPLELELQDETLALSADAASYFTVAEGSASTIWRFNRAPGP